MPTSPVTKTDLLQLQAELLKSVQGLQVHLDNRVDQVRQEHDEMHRGLTTTINSVAIQVQTLLIDGSRNDERITNLQREVFRHHVRNEASPPTVEDPDNAPALTRGEVKKAWGAIVILAGIFEFIHQMGGTIVHKISLLWRG